MTFTRLIMRLVAPVALMCMAIVMLVQLSLPILPLEGDVLLFTSTRSDDPARYVPGDLYLMDLERWWFVQLTQSPGGDMNAQWSPDGKRIAFEAIRDNGQMDIYLIDADGDNLVNLSDHPDRTISASWSPDSQQIMFSLESWNQGTPGHIHIVGVDGDGLHAITEGSLGYTNPVWSPDGTQVAFVMQYLDRWYGDLFVMNSDGTNIRSLTHTNNSTEAFPAWSPDGTRIAYDGFDPSTGMRQIYLVDVTTAQIEQLTHISSNYDPAWSPDGTRIAFTSNRDGNTDIYIMDVTQHINDDIENSPAHRMTYAQGRNFSPAWAP